MEEIFAEITNKAASLEGSELVCFWISQAIGLVTMVMSVFAGQVNTPKWILVLELTMNLMLAFATVLVGGWAGALTYVIAVFVAAFIFRFNKKSPDKPLPKSFIIGSALAFIAAGILGMAVSSGVLSGQGAFVMQWYDILPILASLLFLASLACRNGFGYRICLLINSSGWIVYNYIIGAYTSILTQAILWASLIIGVIRLDVLGRKKQ